LDQINIITHFLVDSMAESIVQSLERLCADCLARQVAFRIEANISPFVKENHNIEEANQILRYASTRTQRRCIFFFVVVLCSPLTSTCIFLFRQALNLPNDADWPYRHLSITLAKAVHRLSPFSGFIVDAALSSATNIFPTYIRKVAVPLMPQEVNLLLSALSSGVTEIDLSTLTATDETMDILSNSSVASSLQKLNLRGALISDKSAEVFLRFPALLELDISNCYHISLPTFEQLARHPTLTSLKARNLRRVEGDKRVLQILLQPENFKTLTSLEAIQEFDFQHEEILQLLASKPNRAEITKFVLAHPLKDFPTKNEFARKMQELLPNLEHFALELEDPLDGGHPLPPQLRSVSLPEFSYSPDAWGQLMSVASSLESISTMNARLSESSTIPFLPHLTSLAIHAPFFSPFPNPFANNALAFGFGAPTTAVPQGRKFLEAIVSGAPQLQHLMLPDMSWTSDDIRYALKNLSHLKTLNISRVQFNPDSIEVSHPTLEVIPARKHIANISIRQYGYLPEAKSISIEWILPEDIKNITQLLQGGSRIVPSLESISLNAFSVQGDANAILESSNLFCSALMSSQSTRLSSLTLRGAQHVSKMLPNLDLTKFVRLTELELDTSGITEENMSSYLGALQFLRKLRWRAQEEQNLISCSWLKHQRLSSLSLVCLQSNQALQITQDTLPCLSNFELEYCSFPTISLLNLPAISSIKMLQLSKEYAIIDILDCPNLADTRLNSVQLQKLTISGCPLLNFIDGLVIPDVKTKDYSITDFIKLGPEVRQPKFMDKEGCIFFKTKSDD
jgi:hypothetical protein